MPFCESGLVPDIIFNPHGYPSRMTIGMMLESMAGKSVSVNGKPEDASPFSPAFDESRPAHEYHGNLLRQAGPTSILLLLLLLLSTSFPPGLDY